VFDIGANIGSHTLQIAKFVGPEGRVFAFEPTAFAFTKQQRNLELNPELRSRVMAFQYFLSLQTASRLPEAIYSSWPLPRTSGVHTKHLGKAMATAGTTITSVDDIVKVHGIKRVDVVKLDVDGFEC
jgi:FkbM family methyltransferase